MVLLSFVLGFEVVVVCLYLWRLVWVLVCCRFNGCGCCVVGLCEYASVSYQNCWLRYVFACGFCWCGFSL